EPLRYTRHVLHRTSAVGAALAGTVARLPRTVAGKRGTHRTRAAHAAHRRDHRRHRLLVRRAGIARCTEDTGRVMRGLAATGQLRDAGQLRVGWDVRGLQCRWPVHARDIADPADTSATAVRTPECGWHPHAADVVAIAEAPCDVWQGAGKRVAPDTRGDAPVVAEPGDGARHRADRHERTVLGAVHTAEPIGAEAVRSSGKGRI